MLIVFARCTLPARPYLHGDDPVHMLIVFARCTLPARPYLVFELSRLLVPKIRVILSTQQM